MADSIGLGAMSSSTLLLGGRLTPSGNSVRQVTAKLWNNVIRKQTARDNRKEIILQELLPRNLL